MYIIATFIGEDGSMGLRTGRRYELVIAAYEPNKDRFGIYLPDQTRVPYATLEAFFRNWSNVSAID